MVLARLALRLGWLLALGAWCWAAPVAAHLTPNSEINLSIHRDAIDADIVVPQGEYAYATGNTTGNDPASAARARDYLARHFAVASPDGRPWSIAFSRVAFDQIIGPPDLHATAQLTPPEGEPTRRFRIDWSALLKELPSHFALFVVASDSDGMVGSGREVLGAVRAGSTSLLVDRGESSASTAFANAMLLGIDHIAGGYDHLLFLLALLLPAPLVARAGRWAEPRPLRATVMQLLKIVTAFTIGHSLTLIGATLGGWRLPVPPVEIAIAVSVLVSALHAIRPIVPGREQWVAIGFGLVHGLAFATLLNNAGAGQASTAVTLLGFNLGIECVQIAIVALVVPPLVVLSRRKIYTYLRVTLAGLTALAAIAWIANRSLGVISGAVEVIDGLVGRGLWMVFALYLIAAFAALRGGVRREPRSAMSKTNTSRQKIVGRTCRACCVTCFAFNGRFSIGGRRK